MTVDSSEVPFIHLTARMAPHVPELVSEEVGGWLWPRLQEAFPTTAAAMLMPDHPHLLPNVSDPDAAAQRLARLLGQLGRRFGVRGQASQVAPPKRFANRDALARDVRYVALNPCRARLVRCPLAWPWSTHRDVVGAIADPWITADRLASVLGRSREEFAARHHAYVSADPSAHVVGTKLPVASAPTTSPMIPLPRIARAVAAAVRGPVEAIRVRGAARTLFVALAREQGWTMPGPLAELCRCLPETIRAQTHYVDPRALAAARLCLGDERLRRLPVAASTCDDAA